MSGSGFHSFSSKSKSNLQNQLKPSNYVVSSSHDAKKVVVTKETIASVVKSLEKNRYNEVREIFKQLHYSDQAVLLENVGGSLVDELIHVIKDSFHPQALVSLITPLRHRMVKMLGSEMIGKSLEFLTAEDSVDFLNSFSRSDQIALLKSTNLEQRKLIRAVRSQPENSAGSIMDPACVTVDSSATVRDVLEQVRANKTDMDHRLYDFFVLDDEKKIVGSLETTSLITASLEDSVASIMKPNFISVQASDPAKDVVAAFNKYDLTTVLVLSAQGEVVGTISIDTVKYIADEQAEQEMMKMGGASDDLEEGLLDTTKTRFIWLTINLITTAAAASVISFFEDVIHKYTMLATWIPIMVSMGTTAGSQASTVVTRAIATDRMNKQTFKFYLSREVSVALFNSIAFALVCGFASYGFYRNFGIAMILGCTVGISVFISVLGGVFIPVIMKAIGTDPAITTSVFLTTMAESGTFIVLFALCKIWFGL